LIVAFVIVASANQLGLWIGSGASRGADHQDVQPPKHLPIYDIGTHEGSPYIVSGLPDGGDAGRAAEQPIAWPDRRQRF